MRRIGIALVVLGVVLAAGCVALAFVPARTLLATGEVGKPLTAQVPGGRDLAVYTTLPGWRTVDCEVVAADDGAVTLRPDMTQQNLRGAPTWYGQGSFELDRDQPITVTCQGPAAQVAIGPSYAIGWVLLRGAAGLFAAAVAVVGVILVTVARPRGVSSRGR